MFLFLFQEEGSLLDLQLRLSSLTESIVGFAVISTLVAATHRGDDLEAQGINIHKSLFVLI